MGRFPSLFKFKSVYPFFILIIPFCFKFPVEKDDETARNVAKFRKAGDSQELLEPCSTLEKAEMEHCFHGRYLQRSSAIL